MKRPAPHGGCAAGRRWLLRPATAALLLFSAAGLPGQQFLEGEITGATSVVYYAESPQMKSRLAYSNAQPLSGGLLVIQRLRLEMFAADGRPQAVVEAPECIWNTLQNTASSAGHLKVQSPDGRILVEGDGFLWQQSDNSLIISNHVSSVLIVPARKLAMP